MADHIKPTKEQLLKNIESFLEPEVKTPEKVVEAPVETKEEVKEEIKVEEPTKEEKKVEAPVETKEEKVEEEEVEVKTDEKELRNRLVESAKEAQKLYTENKELSKAVEKASSLPAPTEQELQKEYSEWDVMSDTEKRLATDNFINKRRFELLDEVTHESKEVVKWHEVVDEFSDNPKTFINFPDLEGKVEDFKVFAYDKTRRSAKFEDIVGSFLYSWNKKHIVKHKGKMFEDGTGGPNTKPKTAPGKISFSEGQTLRVSNFSEYKRMAQAGNIEEPSL